MEKILVDTGAIFDYFSNSGVADAVESLLHRRKILLSSISIFEILAGVKNQKHIEQRMLFLSNCEILPFGKQESVIAAQLHTRLKIAGKLIANDDLFIAASAVSADVPVLTLNVKDFSRIKEIRLWA